MASSRNGSDWSTGLCSCTRDCRSCCLTCWCPCIAFGRLAEIVDKGQSTCCMMGCLYYCLNPVYVHAGWISLAWIISMGYRTKLRRQYGIKGTQCRDCLLHFFCQPCALCQEYRELQLQGFDVSAGWPANAARTSGVTMAPVGEKMTR